MLQTTEGAMQTIDDLLTRMKQLAEQSSTGVYSDTQRGMMNNEFQEILIEIDRIAGSVDFNGNVLLDNTNTITIRFGEATDTIDIVGVDATSTGLSVNGLDITLAANADTAFDAVTTAIETSAWPPRHLRRPDEPSWTASWNCWAFRRRT